MDFMDLSESDCLYYMHYR